MLVSGPAFYPGTIDSPVLGPDRLLMSCCRPMTSQYKDRHSTSPTVSPELGYRDAAAAIRRLTDILGLRKSLVVKDPTGAIAHAELCWRTGVIFLGTHEAKGDEAAMGPGIVCLVAQDYAGVDRIYERAVAAGATIALPLSDTPCGSHQFAVRDPEGNVWTVGTHQPVVPLCAPPRG
jgi:uncharacterized glyoxalase superfamily protein PhnB